MSNSPNVLLICTDHWPGPLLGAAGHERILTPTLDQLAANGVHFTRAYTATPSCIPARRALMTGTTARTHGDRVFSEHLPMDPSLPTLPQVFRDAGYQAYAVGKLHVYPQRQRIGFDEVILCEEGRHHLGGDPDDYERFLVQEGYAGQELTHGMGNNLYDVRPWHLPEHCHPTNWTVREMSRVIQRRDHLYCEHFEEAASAMRMIRSGDHKLIWYPAGNRRQLFDVTTDPNEMNDLATAPESASALEALSALLLSELYGSDRDWVVDGELVGVPEPEYLPEPNRGLSGQRGWR